MKKSILLVTVSVATLLSGCASIRNGPEFGTVKVEDVVRQIKTDINRYNVYAANVANDPPLSNACGGRVNFKISSVSVGLTTVTERSSSGTAGAEIPIGPIKIGASGGLSASRKQSQTLKFKFIPKEANDSGNGSWKAVTDDEGGFTSVLINLRESLIKASDQKPCFTFPAADKQDNSIEFGFTVARGSTTGGKISFLIFNLGGERKFSRQASNTVTVSFKADEGSLLVPPG
jgi:uncharacterized protein YceK